MVGESASESRLRERRDIVGESARVSEVALVSTKRYPGSLESLCVCAVGWTGEARPLPFRPFGEVDPTKDLA